MNRFNCFFNLFNDFKNHFKERIFTLNGLLSEEFLYLWKVPDLSWNVNDVGPKGRIGLSSVFDMSFLMFLMSFK